MLHRERAVREELPDSLVAHAFRFFQHMMLSKRASADSALKAARAPSIDKCLRRCRRWP
jgi:hypothetical protein